jgi:hypothetical protein
MPCTGTVVLLPTQEIAVTATATEPNLPSDAWLGRHVRERLDLLDQLVADAWSLTEIWPLAVDLLRCAVRAGDAELDRFATRAGRIAEQLDAHLFRLEDVYQSIAEASERRDEPAAGEPGSEVVR